MLAELPAIWLRPRAEVIALVRAIDGREHVEAARAAGKGIVFLTPHLGCFEIAAQVAADAFPITVLYRPPKIAWLRAVIEQWRARDNMRLARADLAGRARTARRARAQRGGGHPPRPGAGRRRGRVGGILRQARLHHDAGRRGSRTRPGSACLLAYGERLPGGAGYVLHIRPLAAARPGETPARRVNARDRGADPRMPGAVPLGLQPLQAAQGRARLGAGGRPVTRLVLGLLWLLHFLPSRAIAAIGSAMGAAALLADPGTARGDAREPREVLSRDGGRGKGIARAGAFPRDRPRLLRPRAALVGAARAHRAAGAHRGPASTCGRRWERAAARR